MWMWIEGYKVNCCDEREHKKPGYWLNKETGEKMCNLCFSETAMRGNHYNGYRQLDETGI